MKHSLVIRFASMVLLALWLTGCGFQLRSAPDWPEGLEAVAVRGVPPGSTLEAALQSSGLTILAVAGVDQPVLQVQDFRRDRRTATVRAGRVFEYEWTVSLRADLRLPNQEEAVSLGALSVRRLYRDSSDAVLGQSDDETRLLADMERELARQLQLRLQAALLQQKTPGIR
jgi:LPS-assembly lipoprotein